MKLPILLRRFAGLRRAFQSGVKPTPAFTRLGNYLVSAAVVLAMVGVAFVLHRYLPHANLSLLFLTGVLVVSATTGLGPSLFAALLSFLAFNFLFTPPYYTFEVADEGDLATLAFFLLMAAVTGQLAARMRRESAKRQTSLRRISKLYAFSNQIASLLRYEDVLDALDAHLTRCLERPVVVFRRDDDGDPVVCAINDEGIQPPAGVLEKAWSEVGEFPVFLNHFTFFGLVINRRPLGMVAFNGEVDGEQLEIARSLCEQAAVALDRTRLAEELEESRVVSETEKLRSALLSSVSHDLRTPLAAIIGSSSSLLEYGPAFSDDNKIELLTTVLSEAQRLDRHIQNLLDMTRLGHGTLSLKRDWVDLSDLVASAVSRLDAAQQLLVETHFEEPVPLLHVHGALIEQALFNLLDNAVRFSPPDGRVEVGAREVDGSVEIRVNDQGPGIPEPEREKVFDMFHTVRHGDRATLQGTGLGLAICRGMVGAHGGTVRAEVGPNGIGTSMCISLPVQSGEFSPKHD